MILNFPTLHKNELLYSGIARYFDYLREDRYKWITEHIFSSRSHRAVVGLPSGLHKLYTNLPSGSPYTPEYIIENHTHYPLFRPFIDEDRHNKTIKDLTYGVGNGIKTRLGILASIIQDKQHLYYCSSCIIEQLDQDNQKYLDVYWNRIHQSPSVSVCHKHNEYLKQTDFTLGDINQHSYVSLGDLLDLSKISLSVSPLEDTRVNEMRIKLAENVDWVLNNYLLPRGLNYYRARYIEYLKRIGIAYPSGRVNVLRLKELFLDFYPSEFLKSIDSDFNIMDDQSWVQMIIQKNRKAFHPVRHIMMMILLAGSAREFFETDYIYQPFGIGPWKCSSPVCKKKLKEIKLGFSRDCKKVYGDLKCNCGFSERRYVDGKRKTLEFGGLWENELINLLEVESKGIYYAAYVLEADIATIKKIAKKHNILDKWTYSEKYTPVKKQKKLSLKSKHQELWLNTLSNNPALTLTQIRKIIPSSYIWLYRNDKKFLSENSPKSPEITIVNNRVDWHKRDDTLLQLVRNLVDCWDVNDDKPIRITKTTVGRKTKKLYWLEKFPNKFPKTLEYIDTVVETVEQFQIRRVKWLLNNEFKGRRVSKTKIYAKAALRYDISDDVKEIIADQIYMHNIKVSRINPWKY